jgi:WD40 repeat protein
VIASMKWDLESGKKTADFQGHIGDIVSISMHPEGNFYLTGSVDRTIKLWDLREDTPKQQFVGHEADVNSVCVSLIFFEFWCSF